MRLIKDNVERITEDDMQIRKLMAAGFKPLEVLVQKTEEQKPLEKLKVDELKALAKAKGIEAASSLTRDELLAELKGVV